MAEQKEKKENPRIVKTAPCRLSYANIWEPKSIKGSDPKYSVSVIIPKSDKKTLEKVNAAIQAAYDEGKNILQGKSKNPPSLASLKTPLRDGDVDRPDDEAYKEAYFINANKTTAPKIFDLNVKPITDEEEVYSGCYARVLLSFYAFAKDVNKGIAAGLEGIQKVRDGEHLNGSVDAEDEFSDGFEDEQGFLD